MEISLSKNELTEFQKDWYPYQMLLNDIGNLNICQPNSLYSQSLTHL